MSQLFHEYSQGHTIHLYNDDYLTGLGNLKSKNIKANCVITHIQEEYFEDGINEDNLHELIVLLCEATVGNASAYLRIDGKYLELLKKVINRTHWNIRNTLIINAQEDEDKIKPVTGGVLSKFDDTDIKYILYLSKVNSWLRYTKLTGVKSNVYSANWATWFKGTMVEAYGAMSQISTETGGLILDPFMSYGDVGVGVAHADRHYIGIEPSRDKYNYASKRICGTMADSGENDGLPDSRYGL